MKEVVYRIKENTPLTSNVYKMVLDGDTSAISAPGQFVDLKVRDLYLRRPISVADRREGELTLIYKVVGKGTEIMSEMGEGEEVNALTGLGNGYDLSLAGDHPLLLGGGVGVPPLYLLAKELIAMGKKVSVILGFNTVSEVFFEKEFRDLGCEVTVATADGSYGEKGFVTNVLPEEYSFFYTCGPLPMLKAVYNSCPTDGQFSFEERMGCGFGACMGCSCKTTTGYKRICKDGPVMMKGEIVW